MAFNRLFDIIAKLEIPAPQDHQIAGNKRAGQRLQVSKPKQHKVSADYMDLCTSDEKMASSEHSSVVADDDITLSPADSTESEPQGSSTENGSESQGSKFSSDNPSIFDFIRSCNY